MTQARRLAAIMAVDVAGYSRLMGEDEAGTATAVREHRDAARPLVAGNGGRIVKTMGDGLLLEFPSIVAAAECAVAIQKLMVERNADVADARRIVYRIGLHLGDVLIEGDDILGDGVNIAARLEGIAEPGGICLSGSAYDQVRGTLVTAETGLRHNPSSARLFFVRANAEQGLGRHDEAIADYRRAIELSPREPIIGAWYAQIGGNELSVGNYEAAIAEERKALDLGYRGYFAHAYLAAAHAHLGNGVAAREALAEARNINPRLTLKWLVTHSPETPNFFDGMRKAGLPEG